MSAVPHLPKDAPPVSTSAHGAPVDITVAASIPNRESRNGSITSTLDGDKKSAGNGSWSPSSNDNAESLVDDGSAPLSRTHVFQDEKVAEHWRQLYDRTNYENRHRFDPNLEWTAAEEKSVLRKVDKRVLVWSWIMFMSLDLIRRNINRALADNFLGDLKMNQDDFNNGQVIFLLCFLSAELPSGLISKKLGADIWVPIQIVSWSVISASQSALKNRAGFYICRALQGIAQDEYSFCPSEGLDYKADMSSSLLCSRMALNLSPASGVIPVQILYLSYYYTGKELSTRLSLFYTVLGISQILGAFLAAGFIQLRGLHGLEGWRYLFAFEGLLTGVIGILSFFLLAPSPTNTAGILRGKNGWFTEREEKILVNRVLRDDPTKGDMNNREGVSAKGLWNAIREKDLWPVYLLGREYTSMTSACLLVLKRVVSMR